MVEALKLVHDLKIKLDSFRPLDAETEARIMQKFRLDWNYHSNHIEGNQLTYGETKALILHGITAQGKPLKDHFEITGHNEAVNGIMDIIHGQRPLTETFIKEFHILLLKESYTVDAITPDGKPTKKRIEVGTYKKSPNHVKTKTGEIFYFSKPEETAAHMHDLINWFRDNDSKLDPVILAAEFHYRFIRIHPFDDGNGRMARLLMNFILMKYQYPPVIIKTEDKDHYYSALQQADGGNINAFIKYITENLSHSLRLMIQGADGHDIEEPDDVLKRLALLEQELDDLSKKPGGVPKSELAVVQTYEKNWEELINGALGALEPLSKLFSSKRYRLKFYKSQIDESTSYSTGNSDLMILNTRLKDKLSQRWGDGRVELNFRYTSLKKLPQCSKSIDISLVIFLEKDQYRVELSDHDLKIEHNYLTNLTKIEIETIYREILKTLTDDLRELIDSCS